MNCYNKKCVSRNEQHRGNCTIAGQPTLCALFEPLKSSKEPVAEVPCSDGLSDLVAKWEAKIADYEIRIADAAKIGNDHGQWTLSVRQGELMGALRELRQAR